MNESDFYRCPQCKKIKCPTFYFPFKIVEGEMASDGRFPVFAPEEEIAGTPYIFAHGGFNTFLHCYPKSGWSGSGGKKSLVFDSCYIDSARKYATPLESFLELVKKYKRLNGLG